MPDPTPRIGVVGRGRLGSAVIDHCEQRGLPVVLTASRGTGWVRARVPDVLVDASSAGAHAQVRDYCAEHRVGLVECVSDLTPEQWRALERLARDVPVVRATNLAVGHYVQQRLVRYVAALPAFARLHTSLWERHPATKAHAPSATALGLAETWTAASGHRPTEVSSQRAGLPVSEHEIVWTWPAETVTLRHSVGSLAAAAAGAVLAARRIHGRSPSLVPMHAIYDELTVDHPGADT